MARGLGRAARDALASSPLSEGARYQDFSAKRVQLPVPYQEAMQEVEKALLRQHFEPGNVVLGGFDHLTFGVPVGFYHLVAGTGQGASSLARGRYEQATRELAPSALLVALYAGGRGARAVTGSSGAGRSVQVPVLHLEGLKEVAARLAGRLGGDGLRELARYLQGSREAAFLVCEGGEAAALALHEARGNVARAQAWLSEAKPPRAGPGAAGVTRNPGGVAALVREAAGFTREAVEARLRQAELEAPGARLSGDVAALESRRPSMEAPPRGAQGSPLWGEYVAYWEGRVAELKQGKAVKPPLTWEGYQPMRGWFARGLDFERTMAARLRADAALPRGQRKWLQDFNAPRVETHVGVAKEGVPGVRYTDVLVIDESPPPGQPPRVETFSFKSRDLSSLDPRTLAAQMVADARDALRFYGERLDLRRRSLLPEGKPVRVQVQRIRLVYEGGRLVPSAPNAFAAAVDEARRTVRGVEVSVQ